MELEMTEVLDDGITRMTSLVEAGALAGPGRQAVEAAARLGQTRGASVARAWCVPYLVDAMERAFASDREPTVQVQAALNQVSAFLQTVAETRFAALGPLGPAARDGNVSIEAETGEHYGTLFEAFPAASFWEEARHLLRTRLDRNGVEPARYRGKRVLDAGCGGGRYSVAWRMLGAGHVTGIDVSATGIEDARQRVAARGLGDVVFQEASALELPFSDGSFDVAFSNGVLHHTTDWRAGVRELVRVLAPKGLGWLYLIERPGGLMADIIEILRLIMSRDQREIARAALRILGTQPNRVYYMLDQVMVPINHRLSSEEVASALVDAGATDIRRLSRGTDFDRIEQIYRQRPFAAVKYGIGENRFVFSKG
jgi:ubiquinone/menaquinone biosynthesis C-methylase UbiE